MVGVLLEVWLLSVVPVVVASVLLPLPLLLLLPASLPIVLVPLPVDETVSIDTFLERDNQTGCGCGEASTIPSHCGIVHGIPFLLMILLTNYYYYY